MTIPDRIIRLRTVPESTGLSRSTIYRKITEGTIPPQIKLGVHGAGWRESEINRWIADPTRWRARSRGESPKAFAALALYSPDLNPIEEMFFKFKRLLRKANE